jgi:CubicO group peptidase (beta-lactamase class C family)
MKKQIKPFFLIINFLLILASCQEQAKTNNQDSIYDETDAFVGRMMDSLEIVGLNYAVLLDGKLVHKKAMGLANLEHSVPMTTDKLFAVASISKLFSSTAIHQLLKTNNRSVEETVGEFLPNRNDLPDSWKRLTLKQLLTHTSGIPDQIDYQIYLAPESDELVIEALKNQPFSSVPGETNKYNATGFMLVGLILEELAGQDFESHMQENIFDKFQLTTANYGGFKKFVPNRVTSYRMVGENIEMFPLNYSPTMYAAAGLNINIDELVLWIQAVLNEKILTKENLATIWHPVKLNNNEVGSYGLGWETYELENKIWLTGHGGAGISSIRHYWKEDTSNTVTIILLTNGAKNWLQSPDAINMGIANYFMPGVIDAN